MPQLSLYLDEPTMEMLREKVVSSASVDVEVRDGAHSREWGRARLAVGLLG